MGHPRHPRRRSSFRSAASVCSTAGTTRGAKPRLSCTHSAQALCGVAKISPSSGKTVTKLVTPGEAGVLFKLVSGLTGQELAQGRRVLHGRRAFGRVVRVGPSRERRLIVVALTFRVFGLTAQLGRVARRTSPSPGVFAQTGNINRLSLARLFLFGSRDLWFEVPLPFTRSAEGLGWPRRRRATLCGAHPHASVNPSPRSSCSRR